MSSADAPLFYIGLGFFGSIVALGLILIGFLKLRKEYRERMDVLETRIEELSKRISVSDVAR